MLKRMKQLIKYGSNLVLVYLIISMNVYATGTEGDTNPYYHHIPEDTAGFLDPIIIVALGAYVLGLVFYLYGKYWSKKSRI